MASKKHACECKNTSQDILKKSLIAGFLTFLWLLVRSGTRPSRIVYPCQRAAATYTFYSIGSLIFPIFGLKLNIEDLFKSKKKILSLVAVIVIVLLIWNLNNLNNKPGEINLIEDDLGIKNNIVPNPTSKIFVIQNTVGEYSGTKKLIELMEKNNQPFYKTNNNNGLISSDDVILIKVNSQWNERGGTNTDLVKSLIQIITEHPDGFSGEIIICDNGQAQFGSEGSGGSLNWRYNNAEDTSQSMQKVVNQFTSKYKVSTFLWDNITNNEVKEYLEGDYKDGYIVYKESDPYTGVIVSYPKFKTKYGTYISFKYGVWNQTKNEYDSNKLKVINVPVLKSHGTYGVTASVKHYMGVVSDKLTNHNAHNSVGSGGMGTQMAETRVPTLNIIDAIWINAIPKGGPITSYNKAYQSKIIAVSTDPIALDYWSAKNILMPASKKIGYTNVISLDPDYQEVRSFGSWLLRSKEALNRAGYNYTTDIKKISVYVD
ncbi:MAG TPA: DUF362 domain-containing protein [Methanofastidiosum sp.]|nr:DUF362 domain-containing protein [Methanofastidiosum sp.]